MSLATARLRNQVTMEIFGAQIFFFSGRIFHRHYGFFSPKGRKLDDKAYLTISRKRIGIVLVSPDTTRSSNQVTMEIFGAQIFFFSFHFSPGILIKCVQSRYGVISNHRYCSIDHIGSQ